jgi:hypothetical protein
VELELAIDPAAALEPEIAPVEQLLLAIAPVVAALPIVLVEGVPEHDPAVVELVLVPAAEELVLVPVAVLAGTKSATAAHHRGLPLLTAEDLAVAAVETSLERAATEAAIAWEAVDLVAAEVAGVAEAAVVAVGGDEKAR